MGPDSDIDIMKRLFTTITFDVIHTRYNTTLSNWENYEDAETARYELLADGDLDAEDISIETNMGEQLA